MDCAHCGRAFHATPKTGHLFKIAGADENTPAEAWSVSGTICPACNRPMITLSQYILDRVDQWGNEDGDTVIEHPAYPLQAYRRPVPNEVPAHIAADFREAVAVLAVSNKASAALSRRCLQTVLHEAGYKQRNLAGQIDAILDEQDPRKALPTSLHDTVDAIRNFGNFSAHPVTDHTTLQIIDVDPAEADWCLQILDELFDHFYVKPARADARKAQLNAKLNAAGKPPSKP